MGKEIIKKRTKAVEMLVSELFIRQIVLTLNLLFFFVLQFASKFSNQKKKTYFHIIFLFYKCIVNTIGNLKQSINAGQNSTKPEVFMISSKGWGLGSQPEVMFNASV